MMVLQIIKDKLVLGRCLNCQSTKHNCDGFSVYAHKLTSRHIKIRPDKKVLRIICPNAIVKCIMERIHYLLSATWE